MSEVLHKRVEMDLESPLWERFFTVAPLVVIGTKGESYYDMAPKHMAMPLGWGNYFCFVCSPSHKTYRNILLNKEFTVSYVKPDQVVLTGLAASPRCEVQAGNSKPVINDLPTLKAEKVDAQFLSDSYLFLECQLKEVLEGYGDNSLITGKIIAASGASDFMRYSDKEDEELIMGNPILVYLAPGRFTSVKQSYSFPFPKDFKK